jgi:hypothetical protein
MTKVSTSLADLKGLQAIDATSQEQTLATPTLTASARRPVMSVAEGAAAENGSAGKALHDPEAKISKG